MRKKTPKSASKGFLPQNMIEKTSFSSMKKPFFFLAGISALAFCLSPLSLVGDDHTLTSQTTPTSFADSAQQMPASQKSKAQLKIAVLNRKLAEQQILQNRLNETVQSLTQQLNSAHKEIDSLKINTEALEIKIQQYQQELQHQTDINKSELSRSVHLFKTTKQLLNSDQDNKDATQQDFEQLSLYYEIEILKLVIDNMGKSFAEDSSRMNRQLKEERKLSTHLKNSLEKAQHTILSQQQQISTLESSYKEVSNTARELDRQLSYARASSPSLSLPPSQTPSHMPSPSNLNNQELVSDNTPPPHSSPSFHNKNAYRHYIQALESNYAQSISDTADLTTKYEEALEHSQQLEQQLDHEHKQYEAKNHELQNSIQQLQQQLIQLQNAYETSQQSLDHHLLYEKQLEKELHQVKNAYQNSQQSIDEHISHEHQLQQELKQLQNQHQYDQENIEEYGDIIPSRSTSAPSSYNKNTFEGYWEPVIENNLDAEYTTTFFEEPSPTEYSPLSFEPTTYYEEVLLYQVPYTWHSRIDAFGAITPRKSGNTWDSIRELTVNWLQQIGDSTSLFLSSTGSMRHEGNALLGEGALWQDWTSYLDTLTFVARGTNSLYYPSLSVAQTFNFKFGCNNEFFIPLSASYFSYYQGSNKEIRLATGISYYWQNWLFSYRLFGCYNNPGSHTALAHQFNIVYDRPQKSWTLLDIIFGKQAPLANYLQTAYNVRQAAFSASLSHRQWIGSDWGLTAEVGYTWIKSSDIFYRMSIGAFKDFQ